MSGGVGSGGIPVETRVGKEVWDMEQLEGGMENKIWNVKNKLIHKKYKNIFFLIRQGR